MEKKDLAEELLSLTKNDANRSETARLGDVLNEIEEVLEAGVSRATVLETLHARGFTMTLKAFESALYRLRKKRSARSSTDTSSPKPVVTQQTQAVARAATITTPADLRKARKREINLDDLPDKE